MTGLVAVLYVLGWALTIGAALWAYVQAKRTRDDIGGRMDRIAAAEREHSEVTQAVQERSKEYGRAGAGLEGQAATDYMAANSARHRQQLADADAARDAIKRANVIEGRRPTYGELENLSMLALRWLASGEVAAFRRQGLLAVIGVTVSMIASVWSLYLP